MLTLSCRLQFEMLNCVMRFKNHTYRKEASGKGDAYSPCKVTPEGSEWQQLLPAIVINMS